MRNKSLIYLLLAGPVILASCEENFSPKTELQDEYAVHCIIGITATWPQFTPTVYISSLYDVPGLNPDLNDKDPVISGAKVTLSYNHSASYDLIEDTSIVYHPEYPDSIIYIRYNKYNNPYIYYTDSTEIPARSEVLRLDVELPDGTRLDAETQFPRGIFFEYSYEFPGGFNGLLERWKTGYYWTIFWEPHDDQLYFSSLDLSYIIERDSTLQYRSGEVPLEYVNDTPVYPGYKKIGELNYHFDSVDRFFRSLSEEAGEDGNIVITDLFLNVVQFDRELARYYSSTNGYLDEHSVRLDQMIYSNINGGVGIFGTYKTNRIAVGVDPRYTRSLGYKTSPGE
jgi:hypothetical protein